MRTSISLLALALIGFAILLSAGCKRDQATTLDTTGETVQPGTEVELALPLPPPITDFVEPDNMEVYKNIHFDFDKSDIRPVDRPILEAISRDLKERPTLFLLIQGHCDERGTNEYNLALGERRALSTRAYIAGLGIDSRRMITITLGEEDPADSGHNEQAWAKNRRAQFKIHLGGKSAAE